MKFLLALTVCLVGFSGVAALACDCDKSSECMTKHEEKCKGDKACMEKEMATCSHDKDCTDKNCKQHKGQKHKGHKHDESSEKKK